MPDSSAKQPLIGRLVVIGLGLIGGSFAKGLRDSGACREVVGFDMNARSCQTAVDLGVIDRYAEDLAAACRDADVIQLAVPILAMEKLLLQLAKLDLGHAVLTDVGSAKGNVVRAAREAFGGLPVRYVPGHPIAGSEQSGVEASNSELFRRHKVILTPLPETDPQALAIVDSLWRALGADVEHMAVERHDEVLAATSHLPHLLAFGLVDSMARRNENLDIFRYAAGGFRDFTRIAGSDPVMWHDIFLANRDAVLRTLDTFRHDLDALRSAVEASDGAQLLSVFSRARTAREHFGKILAQRAQGPLGDVADDLMLLAEPTGALQGQLYRPGPELSAFFTVAASVNRGSSVLLQSVDLDPVHTGVIEVLRLMGADIRVENPQEQAGILRADLNVNFAPLNALEVASSTLVALGDSWPLLAVAAACAEGTTRLHISSAWQSQHAAQLRLVCDGLQALGIAVELQGSELVIEGGGLAWRFAGGDVQAPGQHWIAMAFSLTSAHADDAVRIHGGARVAASFPNFLSLCAQVGIRVAVEGQA